MSNSLPSRKTTRLKHFDYSSSAAYFITICTKDRQPLLSEIVPNDSLSQTLLPSVGTGVLDGPSFGPVKIIYKKYGAVAEKYLRQLNDFYDHISIDHYVIMPDHIHILLHISKINNDSENGPSNEIALARNSTPVPTEDLPVSNGEPSNEIALARSSTPVPTGDLSISNGGPSNEIALARNSTPVPTEDLPVSNGGPSNEIALARNSTPVPTGDLSVSNGGPSNEIALARSSTPVPTEDLPVSNGGPSRTPVPTEAAIPTVQNSSLARFVSTFKRFCNKEYGENIWQSRSYEHVIRNQEDYDARVKYIYDNPVKRYFST